MPFATQAGLQGLRMPGPPTKSKLYRSSSHELPIPFRGTAKYLAAASVRAIRGTSAAPPIRFLPPTAVLCAGQRHREPGLPHPTRQYLQVFSTSWHLDPPRTDRPYFMPDPLMGFTLQSFTPPAQPCAVSGAAPLMTSGQPAKPHGRPAPSRAEARQGTKLPSVRPAKHSPPTGCCSMRESATFVPAV
jgi:hypothetical protein